MGHCGCYKSYKDFQNFRMSEAVISLCDLLPYLFVVHSGSVFSDACVYAWSLCFCVLLKCLCPYLF